MSKENKTSQPLLILGKTGTLGKAFAKICALRGLDDEVLGREDVNLADREQIEKVLAEKRPWAVINAAGYVRVDDAEESSNDCYVANTEGPANLASFSEKYNFKLVTFSSDLVFDGMKHAPYVESDPVSPLNIYGRSKALAEKLVLEKDSSALVIRTSAFFGPWDSYNFITHVLSSLKSKRSFTAVNDVIISPTYVPDLVHASLDLLLDGESGIWHLANQGEMTWFALAQEAAKRGGCDPSLIVPVPNSALKLPADRPYYGVLKSEKGLIMPSLQDALTRYFEEQKVIDLALSATESA